MSSKGLSALTLSVLAVVSIVLVACQATDTYPLGTIGDRKLQQDATVEPIRNPIYSEGKVSFSVVSNGCTAASDFSMTHVVNSGRCELEVARTKPDLCRKVSAFVDIELDWELPTECSDMEVVFINPEASDIEQPFTRELTPEQ